MGRSDSPFRAMASLSPMNLAQVDIGQQFDLVCTVKVFDPEHAGHLLVSRSDSVPFLYEGILDGSFPCFTLFQVSLKKSYPIPVVVACKDTVTMGHHSPSWESLHTLVDLCSGFGGLSQGAEAAGYEVSVAVDQNQLMLDLHSKLHDAHCICGDIGDRSVIHQTWKHSRGASVVSSGFSCQPFSRLGDCKGQLDSRSSSLTKTLNAAYYLNAALVVLECVAPAAQDSFVQAELERFSKATGFHMVQTELKLDHVWPCRRHRSWWILSSPLLGPIQLQSWPCLTNICEVQQVIPEIRLWDLGDEAQLALDDTELQAFGVTTDSHAKHLLNGKNIAPCALHAWGSQTRACPCGCRQTGFSCQRLESKGLHGCIVRSAVMPDGTTSIRHLHPNEAMGLNTVDPIIDCGTNVRLTLSAVGQVACPIQSLWIFGTIEAHVSQLRQIPVFSAESQIQAFRAWLLMRCRQVWPCVAEPIHDSKLIAMMKFWDGVHDLSLRELLFPLRWEGKIEGGICIASVLDFLIRSHESIPPTVHEIHDDDEDATPWFDFPEIVDDPDTAGCMYADSCTVVFSMAGDSPVRFQPKCNATVAQFLLAQEKLVGTVHVARITLNGKPISVDHVMEVGQVICIALDQQLAVTCQEQQVVISPTAPWTQPVADPVEVHSPPRKVSKFDVGVCTVPNANYVDQPWLDASPFLGLKEDQLLRLVMPSITTLQQLWSVRHQFFRVEDRLQILEVQGHSMADDEMRFHLHALVLAHRDHQNKFARQLVHVQVIDPLLASAWIQGKGFDCALWARDHPEIKAKGNVIITAFLSDQHWIPVFMSPAHDVLQVSTWDAMDACHDGVNAVCQSLAVALGFTGALVQREHRLFFTSSLCGSLAVAFIRSMLVGTQLPSDNSDAQAIHAMLKDRFVQIVKDCQITDRPWVWGAGVVEDQPASASSSEPQLPISISRDERIDLINANGFAMADDEIRFHLASLVNSQAVQNSLLGRTFVFFEPLVFSCWTSIGRTIAEQWCLSHMEVRTQGKSVVTAFAVDGHWVPLWLSPRGNMLQVHTFQSSCDFTRVEEILEVISDFLDFRTFAIHRIPDGLPEHMMCGAHSMALIAHVITDMPPPETLDELRTLHTNMRASFVAHLYSIETTPRPVVWGNGPTQEPYANRTPVRPYAPGLLPRSCTPEPSPASGSGAAHSWETPGSCNAPSRREYGPLPIMPVASSATAEPGEALDASHTAAGSEGDDAIHLAPARRSEAQNDRLRQIVSHGYAMADDEALFQLEHLAACQGSDNTCRFIVLPPLHVIKWLDGDDKDFLKWIDANQPCFGLEGCHVFTMLLLEQHWIPVWFAPCHGGVIAHSLSDFASDENAVDQVLHCLVHKCGSAILAIHRVPHGLDIQRLCGVMSICFLAHVILRTRMPDSIEEVYTRCWSMKQVFADAILSGLVSEARHWGWGVDRESRPLPIMPVWGPFVAEFHRVVNLLPRCLPTFHLEVLDVPEDVDLGMSCHEMSHHVSRLAACCVATVKFDVVQSLPLLAQLLSDVGPSAPAIGVALLHDAHWSPVLAWTIGSKRVVVVESNAVAAFLQQEFSEFQVWSLPANDAPFCGAATWAVLAHLCFALVPNDMRSVRCWLSIHGPADDVPPGDLIGFGSHGQLLKNLASELSKHGVPPEVVEDRAKAAIKSLGSEQLLAALNHRQSWRQLKQLGNNSKFQFVLPSELAIAVEANKGKPITAKGKGKGKTKPAPHAVDLDPSKLQVIEGTFKSQDRVLSQLAMKQIGPLSSGFILMSFQDAAPYLKAGKLVSQEPLALVVLPSAGQDVTTALPHGPVTVPCRCTVNNEPVLADAVIVQVGQGLVEKSTGSTVLAVDTPDVVTVKVLVYRDELKLDWDEFCLSPIKCLVSLLPILKRCAAENCQCPGWHNREQLPIRDPILDVWRRQYLRQGFKPCPPSQAEFFSVCVRIPKCLLDVLLGASGNAGAYCEPRSADGKEILAEYTVVWAPRHSHQELQHLMQTNPAVTGLARLGDRRGITGDYVSGQGDSPIGSTGCHLSA